jgi:signal transduction histidine kinase
VALHLGAELPDQTRTALTTIRDASRDALVELRSILGVLRAVDDERTAGTGGVGASERAPVPGLSRLPELVERARAAGLDVELRMSGPVERLGGLVDRNAFRIAQESVTNVMKHAPLHRAVVEVLVGDDLVEITVTDAPAEPHPLRRVSGDRRVDHLEPTTSAHSTTDAPAPGIGDTGNGIIGMRERAAAVGGELRAGPRPDGSWRVAARLPRGEDQA